MTVYVYHLETYTKYEGGDTVGIHRTLAGAKKHAQEHEVKNANGRPPYKVKFASYRPPLAGRGAPKVWQADSHNFDDEYVIVRTKLGD